MTIDRMNDNGEVELVDTSAGRWRDTRAPGDDLSDLAADIVTAIQAHWAADVGGMTRADRYAQRMAALGA